MENQTKMICAAIMTAALISNTDKTSEYYAAEKFWKVLKALENEEPHSHFELDSLL